MALGYRLAPVEGTVTAYRYLLDSGIRPERICFAGDSAGGGLAIGAMLAAREAGLPLPGGGWCISPCVDMESPGESFTDRAATDPTVQKASILGMAAWYLGGGDPRHPHAAPLYGDLRGLPPLLIQVGSVETLLDDSLALARRPSVADVRVDPRIWPEMIHVWHVYFPMLATARRAITAGGTFVRNTLRGA